MRQVNKAVLNFIHQTLKNPDSFTKYNNEHSIQVPSQQCKFDILSKFEMYNIIT